jgi:nucleotide-binding universal stress UspA family protein
MTEKPCPALGFERLLLATDGSESAQAAVREAIGIASVCSSSMLVLSVVEVNPEYEALAPRIVEQAEEEARKHVESIRETVVKAGLDCETVVHRGEEPYRFIIEEASKRRIDMIVMGSHGRTGLKRLMMGSVTARVIGHAPCKVLVVPR